MFFFFFFKRKTAIGVCLSFRGSEIFIRGSTGIVIIIFSYKSDINQTRHSEVQLTWLKFFFYT